MRGQRRRSGLLPEQPRACYQDALERLRQADLLYPCFCSRGQLHAAGAPHRSDGDVIYPGTCRQLTREEREARAKLRRPALRIRVPDREISFVDRLQGEVRENLARDCGDFILRRSDGGLPISWRWWWTTP